MARVNPRLIFWIAAVHKHPALSPAHRDILTYLAVMRLNFDTGTGYCSAQSLADGRGWDERTVRRALELARVKEPQLLRRTRRGHRLGDGRSMASEWALIYPPMPVDNDISTGHQNPVEPISTGQSPHLNRTLLTSQPDTGARPTGIESPTGIEETSGQRAAHALKTIDPEITIAEATEVLSEIASRPAVRNPLAVLGAEIANGNGYVLITRARHRLTRTEARLTDETADPSPMAETIADLRNRLQGRIMNSIPGDWPPEVLALYLAVRAEWFARWAIEDAHDIEMREHAESLRTNGN